MTSTLNQDLHTDHRAWPADRSLWQDNGGEGRAELGRALDDLREAAELLRAHAQEIDNHAVELDAEAGPHDRRAARHPQRRAALERLKKYHHTVLARVSLLLKAINGPV